MQKFARLSMLLRMPHLPFFPSSIFNSQTSATNLVGDSDLRVLSLSLTNTQGPGGGADKCLYSPCKILHRTCETKAGCLHAACGNVKKANQAGCPVTDVLELHCCALPRLSLAYRLILAGGMFSPSFVFMT